MSQVSSPVDRPAVTVRALFTQAIGQYNLHPFSTYGGNVQIFVISLRCAESGRISQTRLKIFNRLVKQVNARAKDHLINEVMLVHTSTSQQSKKIHLPLTLKEPTCYAHLLFHVAMVTGHHIM
ncbi:hypothetical protein SDC9_160712 [bioreactor metagenome]|uniref:Uncharacterized protein n=1 Tax=bioreactor metagenome TaxID=1076179 RepID=A0A645FGA3_9ZZZZ